MRLGKVVKRDTQIIIISVLVLTIVTLNVSYSAFFSVQSQSTIQTIETGNLNVEATMDTTNISTNALFPTSKSSLPTTPTAISTGDYTILTLSNTGSLDAEFSVTMTYDLEVLPEDKTEEDLISFDYLIVGIYDIDNNIWINFGTDESPLYYTTVSGLTETEEGSNEYPILRDKVYSAATSAIDNTLKSTRQFQIYVWLAENTPSTEIGKLVYLKLDIKSATSNDGVDE